MEVLPAIIAKNLEELQLAVRELEPHASRVHLDIMDGSFVQNKTISFDEFKDLKTNLTFEVHLMVTHPDDVVDLWLTSPLVAKACVHAESSGDLKAIFEKAKTYDKEVALVMNPETDSDSCLDLVAAADAVQFMQFMTVQPGQYGSAFLPEVIEKIKSFHSRFSDKVISADGGVNPVTAQQLKEAGITVLISGSYIMKSENIPDAINNLKSI
jgi:ribulose-phosphate 3-epimerase